MESKRCTEDCTRCSGEFCERHGTNPCDCDVIDRHTVEAVEAFNTQSPHWGSMPHAVLSQQETADILFARGVIPKPCRKIIQWAEKNAFAKIRALHPELAELIESGSDWGGNDGRRNGIETVY